MTALVVPSDPRTWRPPSFGDILWGRFPFGGRETTSLHPCLVLQVLLPNKGGAPWLTVAPGCSHIRPSGNFRPRARSDMLIWEPATLEVAGLRHPTLFKFAPPRFNSAGQFQGGDIFTLPYGKAFFQGAPNRASPVTGMVDFNNQGLRKQFLEVSRHMNLEQVLQEEAARVRSAPRKVPLMQRL